MSLLLARIAAAHRNVAVAPDNYSPVIIADAPLGYWRLGETTGTAAGDSSGHAYNGTYINCTRGVPPLINNGGGNSAVQGNGASSLVSVGAVAALYNLSRSCSFEFWIKPTSVAGIYGLWSAGYLGIAIRRNNAALEFLRDYSISLGTVAAGLVAGSRYHIVVTVSATGTATFYVNGASIGTLNVSAYAYAGNYVRIGADGKDSAP